MIREQSVVRKQNVDREQEQSRSRIELGGRGGKGVDVVRELL